MTEDDTSDQKSIFRIAAEIVRGLIIGILLFAAITSLALTSSGATIFRYQGF